MRCLLISFFLSTALLAQAYRLEGLVIDQENNEPLSFASISIPGTKISQLSSLSGEFILLSEFPIKEIRVSYVGYISVLHALSTGEDKVLIKMKPVVKTFGEVIIFPGLNPAHRLIRKVIDNRNSNDPYAYSSFSCTTYSKMFCTGEFPADTTTERKTDTLHPQARKFFDAQHLFLTETVSRKKFKQPAKENEVVIGSRVSGFNTSPFFTPVTQLQSFSFYKEKITILDKEYINPISPGTFNRYLFILEDTLFTPQGDSIFVISFRPLKGKNFESLQGVLFIHTANYSLYRVIAEPIDITGVISPHIEQEYLFTNGKWFPHRLHTDWYYNTMKLTDTTMEMSSRNFSEKSMNKIKVVCRTEISDIHINEVSDSEKFSSDAVFAEKDHDQKDSSFWNKYRTDSLTRQDKHTYKKLDSIGKAQHFDRKMKFFEALASGRIALGFIDLELTHLFRYNDVEKARLGLGLITSKRLSKRIWLEGYVAYGAKDKRIKYGGQTGYRALAPHQLTFIGKYSYDLVEPGKTDWFEKSSALNGSAVREYNINWLEMTENIELRTEFRFKNQLKFYADVRLRTVLPDSGYNQYENLIVNLYADGSRGIETVLQLRWQHREKFMSTRFGRSSMGSKWPVLFLRWTGGESGKDYSFLPNHPVTFTNKWEKWEFRMEWSLSSKTKGTSDFRLEGGSLTGLASLTHWFIPLASYQRFGYYAEQTFETMRYNEFAAKKVLFLFHKHDFGKISRKKRFNPSVAILNNIAWGDAELPLIMTRGIQPKTLEKGYFESGFQINGLLRNQFIGLGVQGMYRYGYYSFVDPMENFSFKSTLSIIF